jgi:predicted nucleic acid-binding protein
VILADSSVWINHFRLRNSTLSALVEVNQIASHPFVVGELACGTLGRRAEVLRELRKLPIVRQAEHEEVLALVEARSLMGRGVGWIDAHLLTAALVERVPLWSADRRLHAVASELGVAYPA